MQIVKTICTLLSVQITPKTLGSSRRHGEPWKDLEPEVIQVDALKQQCPHRSEPQNPLGGSVNADPWLPTHGPSGFMAAGEEGTVTRPLSQNIEARERKSLAPGLTWGAQ